MNDQKVVAKSPAPPVLPRSGWIELLQMMSLGCFVGVWLSIRTEAPFWLAVLFGAAGVALLATPFVRVRVPEPPGYPEATHGFRINRERLRTLRKLGVPSDILQAIEDSVLDRRFKKGQELREELYDVLGEERIQPWAHAILLHSRIFREPPAGPGGAGAGGNSVQPGPLGASPALVHAASTSRGR
jgi:hypothetical protein